MQKYEKPMVVAMIIVSVLVLTACGNNEKQVVPIPGEEKKMEYNGKEYDVRTNEAGTGAEINLDE